MWAESRDKTGRVQNTETHFLPFEARSCICETRVERKTNSVALFAWMTFIRCELGLKQNGPWKQFQLLAELQKIIKKYTAYFYDVAITTSHKLDREETQPLYLYRWRMKTEATVQWVPLYNCNMFTILYALNEVSKRKTWQSFSASIFDAIFDTIIFKKVVLII